MPIYYVPMIARRRRTNSGSEEKPSSYSRYQANGTTYVTNTPEHTEFPRTVPDSDMSCRDRTTEFFSAVKSLQTRHTNGVVPSRQSAAVRQRSEFTQIAK